ncbi:MULTISPECIES: hypothetical protein [unclassified Streptomyces]|uniref:hypothetical protein n=1 Tax=unclassified Streptomyces TaxID=2593676 RepID=UPI000701E0DD|nr:MULTISPECIES: hypothetical protein [unclassified Streptomyces]KQX55334.1 hypothetical protein ASD33_31345 [Streptomyces sp. Root1304]KRA95241.1 hypothetical protein ASE09_28825 [Streptomyces sp. Root66D1]
MTGPEQHRNARPDERARAHDRDRDGRGRDERARDGRERAAGRERPERAGDGRERQRYDGQNGGRPGGGRDENLDMDPEPGTDGDTDAERERGGQGQERVRGAGRRSGEPGGSGAGSGSASGSGGRARGPLIGEYAPPYRRRSGRVAAVLLYRNGGHRVIWPDRTEDVNKPMFGSAYTVFEVQLGRNVTEFRLRLPAAGDGVFFEAVAKVQWVVTDPHLVVQEQVEDVAEFLHDELLDGLRRLSRRFRITEAQRADEAVREELGAGRLSFGRDIGLRTRVLVFIDLDDSVKAEVSRRDRVGVTMEADERVAEAERRREAAERALVADRAREMEALFRRGDLAQIAHHMAMHPDKQWEIRTQLQRERREGQADYLAVFNRLLDTGVLERHDIGEQMYQVLMYLRTQTGTVLGGITDRVLNPSGESARRRLEPGAALPEPSLPDWDEEHGDAPHDPRVYEPTRVESGSERDRDRGRDRHRDHGRDRYEPDDPFERTDAYERNDRYDRDDPYDRDGRGDRSRGPDRSGRHSSGFDDWDET